MIADLLSTRRMLFTALGISAAVSAGYYWYCKRYSAYQLPKKWKHIGNIGEIWIFPIKSCGGIKLNAANCMNLGIQEGPCKDRQFMLVDKNDKTVTARTYPKMLKIQPKIIEDELFVSAPGMGALKIDFENFNGSKTDIKAELWDKQVYLIECGSEYDRWFSEFILGKREGLRLVYYPFPMASRTVTDKLKNGIFKDSDTGSLQDVSSYLLINDKSVDELNTRLEKQVLALNFRGNFVVKSLKNVQGYDEDNWNWVKVGNEVVMRRVSQCYRCIFPNIDPISGERDPNFEPLKTLKSYRLLGANKKDPVFGIQLGIRNNGIINLNDEVFVDDI